MTDTLPTAKEIRRRELSERRARTQAEYEERYEVRRLIFGVGEGQVKNLTKKEREFCVAVCRKAYNNYLHQLVTGIPRWRPRGPKWNHPLNPNRGKDHTLTFKEYRKIWWKGNKAAYRRRDVPNMMKRKFEEMHNGGNSAVR